ncbi:hypothetical protein G6F54_014208 [Rhizopus delemar]|nr:hypothetical protein G6F54_014208 [Rhizopus delemar]
MTRLGPARRRTPAGVRIGAGRGQGDAGRAGAACCHGGHRAPAGPAGHRAPGAALPGRPVWRAKTTGGAGASADPASARAAAGRAPVRAGLELPVPCVAAAETGNARAQADEHHRAA